MPLSSENLPRAAWLVACTPTPRPWYSWGESPLHPQVHASVPPLGPVYRPRRPQVPPCWLLASA